MSGRGDLMSELAQKDVGQRARQALLLWVVFIITAVVLNGTIPFLLGRDIHAWTYSPLKSVLFHVFVYAGLFLVIPLFLEKGRETFLNPQFLIPLGVACLGIAVRPLLSPGNILTTAVLVVPTLVYLHWRFDLAGLGFRSKGAKGDIFAILIVGFSQLAASLLTSAAYTGNIVGALYATLTRMFTNPASTTENLFYFGFLAERLSRKARWATPFLIGLMYTTHEMSNPEYWYEGLQFGYVFAGIALIAAIYLWRRSVLVIWLGDGLVRFVSGLF